MLQLQSFAKLLQNNPQFREGKEKTCLVLIGSSRNEGDENRIQSLRVAAKELGIEVIDGMARIFALYITHHC